MSIYYDDNFGVWEDMEDPDNVDFYHQVQNTNVEKECERCGRIVRMQPHYSVCGRCADRIESGFDF